MWLGDRFRLIAAVDALTVERLRLLEAVPRLRTRSHMAKPISEAFKPAAIHKLTHKMLVTKFLEHLPL